MANNDPNGDTFGVFLSAQIPARPLTWRELNAQGVKRCCAMFTDGSRCRRRATMFQARDGNWCAKHGPIMQRATDAAVKAMRCDSVSADSDED